MEERERRGDQRRRGWGIEKGQGEGRKKEGEGRKGRSELGGKGGERVPPLFIFQFNQHSDVIMIKLTARIKFPTKCMYRIFCILKTNTMPLFCNLFIKRPS